ncbi:unnamed protein product [Amoebophrya sp. A25]|nr:unnamed protein product [Amoebophrya sp. A25]|eukprot:GSA25T00004764001.1
MGSLPPETSHQLAGSMACSKNETSCLPDNRRRVLITGFGPFRGIMDNPTDTLVREFTQRFMDAENTTGTRHSRHKTGTEQCRDEGGVYASLCRRMDLESITLEVSCEIVQQMYTECGNKLAAAEEPGEWTDEVAQENSPTNAAAGHGAFQDATLNQHSSIEVLPKRDESDMCCPEDLIGIQRHKTWTDDRNSTQSKDARRIAEKTQDADGDGKTASKKNRKKKTPLVVHFGLYAAAREWQLELRGVNFLDLSEGSDVRGLAYDRPCAIRKNGVSEIYSSLPVEKLRERLQKTLASSTMGTGGRPDDPEASSTSEQPSTQMNSSTLFACAAPKTSDHAGTYLCNYIFYESLCRTKNCLFVHVPLFSVLGQKKQMALFESLMTELLNVLDEEEERAKGSD